jgi:hypothetical protein
MLPSRQPVDECEEIVASGWMVINIQLGQSKVTIEKGGAGWPHPFTPPTVT